MYSRKIQKLSSRRLSIFLRKFVASCPCTQDQTSAPGQLLWRFLSTSVTPWLILAVLLNKAVKFPGYFKSSCSIALAKLVNALQLYH